MTNNEIIGNKKNVPVKTHIRKIEVSKSYK